MAIVFTIINNKGGTGKTTTALNLGAALTKIKKKVLLIDLDSQCNLSAGLGIADFENHVGNLLLGNCSIDDAIHNHSTISVMPGSDKLLEFEYLINNEPGREYLLKETLENIKDQFDYMLIDCPPSLGILSMNSLVAANYYIVPMQTENFAFIGLDKILHVTEKVKKRLNPELQMAGILLVKYSPRTKFSQAVVSNISANKSVGNKLFKNYIRQDINLMESSAFCKSIFEYAPKSRGSEDYLNLAKELNKNYGKK